MTVSNCLSTVAEVSSACLIGVSLQIRTRGLLHVQHHQHSLASLKALPPDPLYFTWFYVTHTNDDRMCQTKTHIICRVNLLFKLHQTASIFQVVLRCPHSLYSLVYSGITLKKDIVIAYTQREFIWRYYKLICITACYN